MAEDQVLAVDETETRGAVTTIADGAVAVTVEKGKAQTVPLDRVVEIAFGNRAEPPAAKAVRIEFATGDVVVGLPEAGAPAAVRAGGRTFPIGDKQLDRVHAISTVGGLAAAVAAGGAPGPAPANDSPVWVWTQKEADGFPADEVVAVGAAGLKILDASGNELDIPWDLLVRVEMNRRPGGAPAPAPAKPARVLLDTTDGCRLSCESIRLQGDILLLEHDLFGKVDLVRARLSRASFRGEGFVFLSDLTPANADENMALPAAGERRTHHPWRRDENFQGGPLAVRGRLFSKGIAAHVHSALTFAVPEGMTRFIARAGVSDEVLGADFNANIPARVTFRVLVDSQVKFESGPKSESDAAVAIDVPVQGARQVTLEVTWTDPKRPVLSYVKGRGVWGGARFIRG